MAHLEPGPETGTPLDLAALRAPKGSDESPAPPTPTGAGSGLVGPTSAGLQRLLLLPTLNEELGLEVTLGEIKAAFDGSNRAPFSVAVIDGGSTDRTAEVAARWGVPLRRQRGRGKGAAIREGLEFASHEGYFSVAVMDADGTYPADALPALYHLLDTGRDLVVGIRRPDRPPTTSVREVVHRAGNGVLNYTAAQLSRRPVLDICSGFWGVRCRSLEHLPLRSDGFEIESELFLKVFRHGMSVAQFPIPYRARTGEAKLHAVRDGSRILLSIVRNSLQPIDPTAVRPEVPRWVRAEAGNLDALLLALNPVRVVFLSVPERRAEAAARAGELSRALPQAEITTAALPPEGLPSLESPFVEALTTPSLDAAAPIVVALVTTDAELATGGGFLVGIPRTQRFVRVSEHAAPASRSRTSVPGFRRERLPVGHLAGLFILSATLEASGTQRELALLATNQRDRPIEVYRRGGPSPVARARALARLTTFPLARLLDPSER